MIDSLWWTFIVAYIFRTVLLTLTLFTTYYSLLWPYLIFDIMPNSTIIVPRISILLLPSNHSFLNFSKFYSFLLSSIIPSQILIVLIYRFFFIWIENEIVFFFLQLLFGDFLFFNVIFNWIRHFIIVCIIMIFIAIRVRVKIIIIIIVYII